MIQNPMRLAWQPTAGSINRSDGRPRYELASNLVRTAAVHATRVPDGL